MGGRQRAEDVGAGGDVACKRDERAQLGDEHVLVAAEALEPPAREQQRLAAHLDLYRELV